MDEKRAILFSDQAFSSFADKPVKHPNEQNTNQGDDFVYIKRVSEYHRKQQELEDFLLTFVTQMLLILTKLSKLTLVSRVLI